MFKIPIDNEKNLIKQSKSQAGQDLFVVAMLQGKKNGTFLEIGGGDPVCNNNTWLLERFFNFTGDTIEIGHFLRFYKAVRADSWPSVTSFEDLPNWIQQELKDRGYNPVPLDLVGLWADDRPNTNFHLCDALNFDYDNLNSHYDYLQIDIDPPMANLSMLEKLIPTHEFSVITFEHDLWRMTDEVRFVQKQSREFLGSHNYTLLVDDVTIQPGRGIGINDSPIFFEDWYVNKKFINQDVIDAYKFIAPNVIKYYPDILCNLGPQD